jgi:hypothetical protein
MEQTGNVHENKGPGQQVEKSASGVVWNYLPYEPALIPAKLVLRGGGGAGIQPVERDVPEGLRSGFPPSRE